MHKCAKVILCVGQPVWMRFCRRPSTRLTLWTTQRELCTTAQNTFRAVTLDELFFSLKYAGFWNNIDFTEPCITPSGILTNQRIPRLSQYNLGLPFYRPIWWPRNEASRCPKPSSTPAHPFGRRYLLLVLNSPQSQTVRKLASASCKCLGR